MEMQKLQANIWKLNFIKAARSFMVTMPIIVLFFQERGLSMKEVMVLQSIFSIAVLILEVPSGYFSDRFGRKRSIVVGWGLVFIGFFSYALANGFWGFLLAELMLGLGASFISGTDSALLYDTLLELDRKKEYKSIEGRNNSMGLMSEGVASIIGGFLALISLSTPIYCEALITFATFPVVFSIYEPKRKEDLDESQSIQDTFITVVDLLKGSITLRWIIFYSAIVATATLVMVWFIQPYLKDSGVEVKYFGIIWASLMFISAITSWNVQRIEDLFGKRTSLAMLLILPVTGYFLLSSLSSVWVIGSLVLFYIARGVNNPLTNEIIQNAVSSQVRATILSVKNLFSRLFFVVMGPAIGWVNDFFTLKTALFVSGVTFLAVGFALVLTFFYDRCSERQKKGVVN